MAEMALVEHDHGDAAPPAAGDGVEIQNWRSTRAGRDIGWAQDDVDFG